MCSWLLHLLQAAPPTGLAWPYLVRPAFPALTWRGCAGTNDNHRLLPLQVRQHLEVEAGLRATNGKMLAALLDLPYHTLQAPQVNAMLQQ